MIIPKSLGSLLGVSLLCGAGLTALAQNNVTFQVDMTSQPSATSVFVRGSFNGWGTSELTNNGSGIYSGTVTVTDTAGTLESCKFFYQPGDNWEGDPNRQFVLAGGAQTLPLTSWNVKDWPAPNNNITFQIDMTAQVRAAVFDSSSGYVRVSGAFNGWSESVDFTNNPSASGDAKNIFSQTLSIAGYPGAQPGNYKFRAPIGDTWETISDRPSFTLVGGDQTLPLVYWNNLAPSTPTNNVTFQVDMTPQVVVGNWVPGQFIRVAGAFTGWGDGVDLTNNPALSGNASNIYSTVIGVVGQTNNTFEYKFRANGGWESPTSTANNNRVLKLAGGAQVLPLVFYSDDSICDLLTQNTDVTFLLHLTNGTVATDGTVYDGSQEVKINGEFNSWASWDALLPQMTPTVPGQPFYQYTTTIPAGRRRAQVIKFSIGGADNEAPSGQDHIQYIRGTSGTYTLATAEFGTNYSATRVEQAFGKLKVGTPVGGNVPVTWLGFPCVTLQSSPNLTGGTWTDLPATDGQNSTNVPNAGGQQFFRLQKRPQP